MIVIDCIVDITASAALRFEPPGQIEVSCALQDIEVEQYIVVGA